MVSTAVLCGNDPVPFSEAAAVVESNVADDIDLLLEYLVKRKLKHGSSNCLSNSLHERTLQCDGMIAVLCIKLQGVLSQIPTNCYERN